MPKYNLSDVIQHDDFTFALCTFIDEFKRSQNKAQMIESPPNAECDSILNLCLLAGLAHKLAVEHGLRIPEWVYDSSYKMPSPYFAYNTQNEEYQAFLLEDTPHEFASRNLFIGANAMGRV
ncbi:MAG: hypothetical protein FWC92_07770 [Defluviitaleaceae bacterium]|nr:hypothetical protein [Defluviitaleaceae bacterium]